MIFRWRGATNTAWDTGTNWINEAGTAYALAVYPGNTAARLDDVYLDAVPMNALAGFSVAQPLRSLNIGAACTSAIASSGSYLIFNATDVNIDAGANCFLDGGNTPGMTNVLCIDTASGVTINLKGYLNNVTILDATVTIDTGSINGSLIIGSSSSSTGTVTISATVTAMPATVQMNGGTVTCSEAITTLTMNAGTWTQSNAGSTGLGNITTLNLYGGTFNWNGGNITTANAYGGTLSTSAAGVERRIGTMNLYAGGTVDLSSDLRNTHITSYIHHLGGALALANGFNIEEYRTPTYAGSSDAVQGIAPQSVAENTNTDSTAIYVAPYDRVDAYITLGATDVVTTTAKFQNSETLAGTFDDVTDPAAITWNATDDNKTKKLTMWGYQCAEGHSAVRIRVNTSLDGAGHAALVHVILLKQSNT